MNSIDTEAVEVNQTLTGMKDNSVIFNTADGLSESIEEYMRLVIEEGEFFPGPKLTTELDLTVKERLSGRRTQDVTAVFGMGLMLGAAMERDIPQGSEKEQLWKNGDFTFSETQES